MPAVTPPVPSSAARNAAPLPPSASESDRPDRTREPRSKSIQDRFGAVAPEPHWTAAIDAATD